MMRCEFCGEATSDVTVRQDPFAWVVLDEDDQVPMCDGCEQTRFDDS